MKSRRSFGMPLELAPPPTWYEQGRCAVVANVGTLARPITTAEFKAGVGLPAKLFSHNDQAATWQSLQPEGAPTGWGGRMGDILMAPPRCKGHRRTCTTDRRNRLWQTLGHCRHRPSALPLFRPERRLVVARAGRT